MLQFYTHNLRGLIVTFIFDAGNLLQHDFHPSFPCDCCSWVCPQLAEIWDLPHLLDNSSKWTFCRRRLIRLLLPMWSCIQRNIFLAKIVAEEMCIVRNLPYQTWMWELNSSPQYYASTVDPRRNICSLCPGIMPVHMVYNPHCSKIHVHMDTAEMDSIHNYFLDSPYSISRLLSAYARYLLSWNSKERNTRIKPWAFIFLWCFFIP